MNKNRMNGFLDNWIEASAKQRAAGILPAVRLPTDAFFCRQDAGSTLAVAIIRSLINPLIHSPRHFR
jgi:hypothetical protein